jgi:hypothetical protein
MYSFAQDNEHVVWRELWYNLTWRVSLQTNLYLTWKDQVFVTNVVVSDPTQKTMALNVINQPTNVVAKLRTIAKICKYKGLHEGHHFISMVMEVHDAPRCDMDCLIKKCVRLFHGRQSRGHLSLSFCIDFFN